MSDSAGGKIFPYKYRTDDFPTGLRLITIPTDYPNLVAIYIVVRAGSRNEVEEGKSGFAHLFEHLMFRGTEKFPPERYDEVLKNLGADHNAYTSDDRTVYHIVFSREDLDQIVMLEADRFRNLKVPIEDFRTETRAVLGEYNKNASNPTYKLLEVARDTAFERHTYRHTAMGFIRDIERMPDMYDYSIEFFHRYYRPENTIIVLAGDVGRDEAVRAVDRYWGDWKLPGSYAAQIPDEPEQTDSKIAHVDWPTATLPMLLIGFKGPCYSDERKDMPAMDLISNLAFAESSELYQRLVVQEQKVDTLLPMFEDHMDPYLVSILARVKKKEDVAYVQEEILKTFESYSKKLVSGDLLEAVKSHMRYGFALSLDNSQSIAAHVAPYVALRRDPETINRLYHVYGSISPEDIKEVAGRYFTDRQRTIVTLASNGR